METKDYGATLTWMIVEMTILFLIGNICVYGSVDWTPYRMNFGEPTGGGGHHHSIPPITAFVPHTPSLHR